MATQSKFRSKEKILHKFSEQELIELGQRLTSKMDVLEANKSEKKDSVNEWNRIIKKNEDSIDAVKNQIQAGEEQRYVETQVQFNWPENGMKQCIRVDNGEILWTREMTTTELTNSQMSLFPDGKEYVIVGGSGVPGDEFIFKPADELTKEEIEGWNADDNGMVCTTEPAAGEGVADVPFETPTGYKCPKCGNEITYAESEGGQAILCTRCPDGEYRSMDPVYDGSQM